MRGIAAAPNSPLDIMLGLVDPIDPIHNEMASKSKPRQTDTRAAPLVMTASAPADGCTDRGAGALVQGYRCTSTAPLVRVSHHGAVTATRASRTGSPLGGRLCRRVRREAAIPVAGPHPGADTGGARRATAPRRSAVTMGH